MTVFVVVHRLTFEFDPDHVYGSRAVAERVAAAGEDLTIVEADVVDRTSSIL